MGIEARILNAAREMIIERGFNGWTVDELSHRAGISKRTLYRYFSAKELIIESVLEDFFQGVSRELDKMLIAQSDPLPVLQHILQYLLHQGRFITGQQSLEDLRRVYPHLWNRIDEFRMQKIKMMIAYVARHRPNSLLAEIDPLIVTTAITSSIQAVINPAFILENGLTFSEVVEQLSRFLMASLNI